MQSQGGRTLHTARCVYPSKKSMDSFWGGGFPCLSQRSGDQEASIKHMTTKSH